MGEDKQLNKAIEVILQELKAKGKEIPPIQLSLINPPKNNNKKKESGATDSFFLTQNSYIKVLSQLMYISISTNYFQE